MKISIVTINYNNRQGLIKTIKSVTDQTYQNIEYIIIDGGSKDGSAEYIESNSEGISYWVSEQDSGIYNAMNKGIRKATGDYLLFLNSGDQLFHKNILNDVNYELDQEIGILYGNELNQYDEVVTPPDKLTPSFLFKSSLRHQSMFIKRGLFEEVFNYNENLKIVSDWEFTICAILKYGVSYKHIDIIVSRYEGNGISQIEENLELRSLERKACLQIHFGLFLDDYEELEELRKISRLNRYKLLVELESYPLARKINSVVLMTLQRLFRN